MFAAPQHRPAARYQAPPATLSPDRRVQRTAEPAPAWRRLATAVPVSRPGDAAELEADRVADAIVRGEPAQASPAVSACPGVQRRCAACEEEQRREDEGPAQVQRKPEPGQPAHDSAGDPASPIASGGAPLSPGLREYFEPRLGADLGTVRIHTGSQAARSARDFGARAYTFGSHIVFGPEGLDSGSQSGRHLLAHELVHTVQQSGRTGPVVQRQESKDKPWIPIPVFDQLDPCIVTPQGQVCGSDAKKACEKVPAIPGCSFVCKKLGCKTSDKKIPICPPGWHESGASDLKGLCCQGTREDARFCCPPERVASADNRCCAPGEDAVDGRCTKPKPFDPSGLCLTPGQKAPSGECCFPPKVPGDWDCVEGATPPPQPQPLIFDAFEDRLRVLFKQGQPREGQSFEDSLAGGREELDQAIGLLKKDLSTGAQLVANASHEGEPDENLELTDRRLAAVSAQMKDVAWKVRSPIPQMDDTEGCRGSWGAYSCGEKNADPKTQRPGDRNVTILIFRPTELKPLPPWSPIPPLLPQPPWAWPGTPKIGPF